MGEYSFVLILERPVFHLVFFELCLPATLREFEKLLMTQGAVLSTYAEGAFDDFMKNGRPAWVGKTEYESWPLKPQRLLKK